MNRIININNPTKLRNRNMRTLAEILRRLGSKQEVDDESRDMAAAIVFLLRDIYQGVDKSAKAWEKRGYWMKADRFLREWEWTAISAADIEDVIRNEAWDLLPLPLAELLPRTSSVEIKKMTRSDSEWNGAYQRLLTEPPGELPW